MMNSMSVHLFSIVWRATLVSFLFLLLSTPLQAQHLADKFSLSNSQQGFIENKGQVADQNGRLRNDVKYIYSAPGFQLILKENSFSYQFYSHENQVPIAEASNTRLKIDAGRDEMPEPSTLKIHRVDITLKGASKHPTLIPEGRSSVYSNYYLAHTPEEGVTEVYAYDKVTYKDIYPNIDFVFYANNNRKLKYDIVVHPGGRLTDIKLAYTGMAEMGIAGDKLIVHTSLGVMRESIPLSYLQETGEEVRVLYSLTGSTVSFKAEEVLSKTLVIDPILMWGTYFGGDEEEAFGGTGIATDKFNTSYIIGRTQSSDLATQNSYQTTLHGSEDVIILCLDSSGKRLWSTYFGGEEADREGGIAVSEEVK